MWSPAWKGFQKKSSAIGLNLLRSSSEKMGGISGGNKLPIRLVLGYGLGHVFNDVCASLWFTYLLIFLQKVNSPFSDPVHHAIQWLTCIFVYTYTIYSKTNTNWIMCMSNHFWELFWEREALFCPNRSHFCNEQCMFFIKWCFLMEWALSFDLIFLHILFIFGNLFSLPAKIKTNRTDWKNAQVLKFNSADAGKGFLNSVTSTMERTIFLCLSPMLWWYREPSKSLTQSSEVLLFWRNKEGLGL